MSVAFILNPGYNTINNIHHTFWDQEGDAIANSSLTQALAVSTSVAAPSHVITGGTNPAQLFMSDPITLETDAPQFKAGILQAPTAELEEITELTPAAGITFLNDAHFTSGTGVDEVVRDIDGVGTLTCSTLKYTTLDPAIPEADVSQWATFGASTNVNLNGKNLTDSSKYYVTIPQAISAVVPLANGDFEFGNSNTSSSAESTMTIFTARGQAGSASGQIKTVASTRTTSQTYSSKAGCTTLISYGGDVQIGFAGSGSNLRLCYSGGSGGMTKALTLNNYGALAFNSSFIDGTETVGSFGTAGQIIQSNGSSLPPSWVDAPAPGDPSTWSEYPATQDVDMGTNQLTNCSAVDITTNSNIGLVVSNPLLNTYSTAGFLLRNIGNGSTIPSSSASIEVNGSNFGNSSWLGKPSALNVNCQGDVVFYTERLIKVNKASPSTAFVMNNAGALSFGTSFNAGTPLYNFGTSGQVLQSNGTSAPSWVSLPVSAQYVLYVAKNGLDSNAGTITSPKLTIQSAINAATALYPQQVAIIIAPGVYSGNLSITSPNITLLGYAPSANQNLLTQIVGNISIACTASQDLFYSQIGIFNLQVAGSITDTSSAVHSLNIEQCRLAGDGRIVWQNSSANNRTRLERVVLLHSEPGAGTDPLLCFSSGMATLNLLDITSKDNAPVLQFDGTATLNTCTLCNFSSTTTSATAAPIVYIAIANGGTAPFSQKGFAFAYCAFTYSASVARAFSSGKNCGIVTDSITGNVNLIITYNAFNLLLCDATCFVVSDINKNTPSKASTVRFFSNLSTYLATGIDTLAGNKTTFAAVT